MGPDEKTRPEPRLARRWVAGGLLGTAMVAATRSLAASNPPPFSSMRHQFTFLEPITIMSPSRLVRLDGTATNLPAFRGRVVLLNFWATWCPACRDELPELDRLQALMAGTDLRIAAVSIDRQPRVIEPFLRRLNIKHLTIYIDPNGEVARPSGDSGGPFALYGMLISYVIDRSGRTKGYMPGEAAWTSDAGRSLLN